MKFTKEEAYKELVARLTANGEKLNLSERSINEQLDTLIPLVTNDETELNDFVCNVMPVFKTADANVRNDISVGIKEYKEKNPVTPKVEPKNEPNPNDNALEERLKALEEKSKEAEHKLYVTSTKASLASKLKEKGVKNDKWIESLIGEINITEDFNVEEKAESYLGLYNSMMSSYNPNATPHTPSGSEEKYTSDTIKAAGQIAKSQSLA